MIFMFKYVWIIQPCFGEHWQNMDSLNAIKVYYLIVRTTFVRELNCNKQLWVKISNKPSHVKKRKRIHWQCKIQLTSLIEIIIVNLLSSFCCAFKSPNNCCKYFVIVHSNCCRKKFAKRGKIQLICLPLE